MQDKFLIFNSMKSEIINERKQLKTGFSNETYEGESIEKKCARMIENNEPITDGAPLVYTERADGVRPEFNVRTDKWDIAQESMEKVSEAKTYSNVTLYPCSSLSIL